MITSIIGVRLIDEYILDMQTWIGVIISVLSTITLYKVVESIPKFDRQITRKTQIMLKILTLSFICVIFYTFTL